MARLMSVAATEACVVARVKTVTRRRGWLMLKAGDRLTLVRKAMGRKADEPLVRLAEVEVLDVRREPLTAITADDCTLEGFAGWQPERFVQFYVDQFGGHPDMIVTRIEWRYLDG